MLLLVSGEKIVVTKMVNIILIVLWAPFTLFVKRNIMGRELKPVPQSIMKLVTNKKVHFCFVRHP